MTPRHVLLTTDAVGGVWTYALDLAAGLIEHGVSVTLVVFGPSPLPIQWDQAADIAGLRVVDTGLPLDWLVDDPARLDAAAEAFADFATRSGADLVHLNTPALLSGPIPIATVGGCHSCVATWWDAVRGGALPAGFSAASLRLQRGYRACDALIAPSHAFAEATRRRHGVAPRVVANGRRTFERRPASRRTTALCSGRLWDQGKNLIVLDRAAGRMRHPVEAAGPLVGPGGQAAHPVHVRSLGLLGADTLAGRLAASAVFVSPALYEPFGLGVLEAAQAGCALVLADIPTFRELWSGAAVFIDPHEDRALAMALDGLLDDGAETRRLGDLAREHAGRFTVDAMVQGVLAAYDHALALRAGGLGAAA
jgi:glycogen(starch) synthase